MGTPLWVFAPSHRPKVGSIQPLGSLLFKVDGWASSNGFHSGPFIQWAIPFLCSYPPPPVEGLGIPAGIFLPDPRGRVWIFLFKLRYHPQVFWNSSRIFPRERVWKGLDFGIPTEFFDNDIIHRVFPWIFFPNRGDLPQVILWIFFLNKGTFHM